METENPVEILTPIKFECASDLTLNEFPRCGIIWRMRIYLCRDSGQRYSMLNNSKAVSTTVSLFPPHERVNASFP
jgi:hypothetical protein